MKYDMTINARYSIKDAKGPRDAEYLALKHFQAEMTKCLKRRDNASRMWTVTIKERVEKE